MREPAQRLGRLTGIGAGIVAASALLWATAIRPGSGSSPVAPGDAPDADEPREALAA